MTYTQSVDYLLALLGASGQRLGLERITKLVELLGRPDKAFRIIHIAGTNGKGSTGAMIEAGLRANGSITGFFSSPHLSEFSERFRVSGQPIDKSEFADSISRCRDAAEQLASDSDGKLQATMFEVTTAAAFCAFELAGVEWAVIETGLGGRLDSTNVVEPDLTVITPIALDHEATLGNDLASIAAEKAGILKPGVPTVYSLQLSEAEAVLAERGTEVSGSVTWAAKEWQVRNAAPDLHGRFRIEVDGPGGRSITSLLGLPGEHQVENAVTAIAALDAVGISDQAIAQGLKSVEWPGRLEWIGTTPGVLLDAAHNPAGAHSLAHFMAQFCTGRRITLIFGVSRDKAVDEMAGALFPLADRVVLTRSAVRRSQDAETLAEAVGHHGRVVETSHDAADAWKIASRDQSPEHLVVIAGSIFLVGELREQLLRRGPRDA